AMTTRGHEALLLLLLAAVGATFVQADDLECSQDGPLGMITGEIRDWQITASSTFPSLDALYCQEKYGRLYLPNGRSWCAQQKGTSEWLQVDLGVEALVTGVMTQGRGDGKEWVTAYRVTYSQDANKWNYVDTHLGTQRVFDGNVDSYSVKHNYFDQPVRARFIRLHPVKFRRHPSMRMEIIGCQPCKQLLSVPPYDRLSASSARGRNRKRTCDPSYGHILTNKGWCAKIINSNQWLQLDLGPPTKVTGLVTKGRGDGKGNAWVTAYRIAYSNDERLWTYYKDAAHQSPREERSFYLTENGTIFGGNSDRNTERVHYLSKPFVTRYIRFHPVTWHRHISMRAGVYGCPHRGACGPGYFRVNNATRCQGNLAFGKNAYVNDAGDGGGGGGKHRKRHLGSRNSWQPDLPSNKAVDGVVARHSCDVLSNAEVNVPAWVVDLKTRQPVQGVFIYTGLNDSSIGASLTRHLDNLDRLEVYVAKRKFSDDRGSKKRKRKRNRRNRTRVAKKKLNDDRELKKRKGKTGLPERLHCGTIRSLNWALQRPRIHVPCSRLMNGRYVYLQARGSRMAYSRRWQFKTALCEVIVY
ncbi:hypothetical protein BOX15_Mlig000773g3, partial [Macrostomum lignano]